MIKVKVKRTLHSSKHSHSTPPITSPPHLAGPDEAEVLACLKVEEGGFGAGAIGRVKPVHQNHKNFLMIIDIVTVVIRNDEWGARAIGRIEPEHFHCETDCHD